MHESMAEVDSDVWTTCQKDILLYLAEKVGVREFMNQERVFLECINAEFITTRKWDFEGFSVDEVQQYPLLEGAFELSHRKVLAKNLDYTSNLYHFVLHASSGRCDGRLFLAKKLNVNGRYMA